MSTQAIGVSKSDFKDGKCIMSASEFESSTAEWFIVYNGMRTLQSREDVEKWNTDTLEFKTQRGQLFEAEEKE